MGTSGPKCRYISPNTELRLCKAYVKSEEESVKNWPIRWGWILDEYQKLKNQLDKITEKSVIVKKKEVTDLRKILPVPDSVNHEYGWICSKPEFKLEIYGPDVPRPKPIPEF